MDWFINFYTDNAELIRITIIVGAAIVGAVSLLFMFRGGKKAALRLFTVIIAAGLALGGSFIALSVAKNSTDTIYETRLRLAQLDLDEIQIGGVSLSGILPEDIDELLARSDWDEIIMANRHVRQHLYDVISDVFLNNEYGQDNLDMNSLIDFIVDTRPARNLSFNRVGEQIEVVYYLSIDGRLLFRLVGLTVFADDVDGIFLALIFVPLFVTLLLLSYLVLYLPFSFFFNVGRGRKNIAAGFLFSTLQGILIFCVLSIPFLMVMNNAENMATALHSMLDNLGVNIN